MAVLKTRPGQCIILVLAVLVLGWLFIRAAGGPGVGSDSAAPGALPNRSATVSDQPEPTQRYTVVTPGSDDRGARRIISGREGDRYYTADHYATFSQISEGT